MLVDDVYKQKKLVFSTAIFADPECKGTVGTLGFRDPWMYMNSFAPNQKCDVFSYGVTALQVLSLTEGPIPSNCKTPLQFYLVID